MATGFGSVGGGVGGGLGVGVGNNHNNNNLDYDQVSLSSSQEEAWIEANIRKRECIWFSPTATNSTEAPQQQLLCQCGRSFAQHHGLDPGQAVGGSMATGAAGVPWRQETHTAEFPTDAYGVIEFASGPHPTRARYIRLADDTDPSLVLHLLTNVWRLPLPKLVLSVHGGMQNFELQPRLRQLALNGLLKAAKTTDAWLISTGLDNGVSRLVGEAIGEEARARDNRISAIGIAPWGVIRDRDQLIGRNRNCKYFAISSAGKSLSVLNRYHSYFLLVDDGRCGAYGTESQLRRSLERFLCNLRLCKSHFGVGLDRVPVVATLLEGGASAFRLLLDLTLGRPSVPVVVCDGSGRAADILAFVHKYSEAVLNQPELINQLVDLIEEKFHLTRAKSIAVIQELRMCLLGPGKQLIFVFRPGEGLFRDLDDAILTSLLTSQRLSRSSQLKLTMAWDRVDLARSHLFQYGQEWKLADLERALMEALLNNRLEFVRLFLEWGVNVERFLTRMRLEELYSFCFYSDEHGSGHDKHLRRLLKRTLPKYSNRHKRLSLYTVGRLVQELIGGGYTHEYARRYAEAKAPLTASIPAEKAPEASLATAAACPPTTINRNSVLFNNDKNPEQNEPSERRKQHQQEKQQKPSEFRFPYTDLMTWAVLCRRYTLAWFFLQCGEDSTAKALYAAALLRAITGRVDEDVQSEYYHELSNWADRFESEALAMLEHCHRSDPRRARRLLTYRLGEFGGHTSMSLAYTSRSMRFLSHACPQVILNDLWYGGIRESGQLTGLRVVLLCAILAICPPAFFLLLRARFLSFKSLAELRDQPQTRDEFADIDQEACSVSSDGNHADEDAADATGTAAAASVAVQPASTFVEPESLRNLMRAMPSDSLGDKLRRMESPGMDAADEDVDQGATTAATTTEKEDVGGDNDSPTRQAPLQRSTFCSGGGDGAGVGGVGNEGNYDGENKSVGCPAVHRRQTAATYPTSSKMLHYHVEDPAASSNNNKRIRSYTYRSGLHTGTAGQQYQLHHPGQPPALQHQQKDRLPYRICVSEFFSAPITRYWLHLMSYAVFIGSFLSYILVVLPQQRLVWQELVVFAYVVSYGVDKIREISLSGGRNWRTKLLVHLDDAWNVYDLFVCCVSAVGMATRLTSLWYCNQSPGLEFDFYANYSRMRRLDEGINNQFAWQFNLFFCSQNVMVLALGLWLLRVFEVLINWKHLGPYLYMVASMIGKMLPPVVIIFIPLCAFGIVRQGIQNPYFDTFNITVVKGILLKPYFMLYGEVYADEIDPDGWSGLESLMPLRSVVPISMVIFLLVTVIVCISIVIAVFNDIYHEVHEKSKQVYKYLRFSIIIEYESMPVCPPPFSIFSWLYLLVRRIRQRVRQKRQQQEDFQDSSAAEDARVITTLKLFLRPEEAAALQNFECQCVQDLLLIRSRGEARRLVVQGDGVLDSDSQQQPLNLDPFDSSPGATVLPFPDASEAAATAAADAAAAAAAAVATLVGQPASDSQQQQQQQPTPEPLPPPPPQRQPSIRRPLRRASSTISETVAPADILQGLRPAAISGYTNICDSIDVGPSLAAAAAAAAEASDVSTISPAQRPPPAVSGRRRLEAALLEAEENERSALGATLRSRLRQLSITAGDDEAGCVEADVSEAAGDPGRDEDEKASLQDIMEVALERLVDAELRDCDRRTEDVDDELMLMSDDGQEVAGDDGAAGAAAAANTAEPENPTGFDFGDLVACSPIAAPDETDSRE